MKAWLAEQPEGRFEFTFTPKHGSWLNLAEGFFSKLIRSVLRHIRVASKREVRTAIRSGRPRHGDVGALMQSLKNDAVNSLKARSHFILGQLLRCLTAHRVPLTDENLIEAAILLRETIETQESFPSGATLTTSAVPLSLFKPGTRSQANSDSASGLGIAERDFAGLE